MTDRTLATVAQIVGGLGVIVSLAIALGWWSLLLLASLFILAAGIGLEARERSNA